MKLGFCMWKISMQIILRGHFPSVLNSLFLRINHLWLFLLKQAFHIPDVNLYKTFENNIFETDVLSAAPTVSWCSFSRILYTFNVCNKSLYLKYLQLLLYSLDIRKTRQMLANFFHRIWILEKKTILLIIKKHSAIFLSV